MSKKLNFRTVNFDSKVAHDYPKGMPIPRIGERVIIGDLTGKVYDVSYVIGDTITDITIYCTTNY